MGNELGGPLNKKRQLHHLGEELHHSGEVIHHMGGWVNHLAARLHILPAVLNHEPNPKPDRVSLQLLLINISSGYLRKE